MMFVIKTFSLIFLCILSIESSFCEEDFFIVPETQLKIVVDSSCRKEKLENLIRTNFEKAYLNLGSCLEEWGKYELDKEERRVLTKHKKGLEDLKSVSKANQIFVTCKKKQGTCGHADISDRVNRLEINIVPDPECYGSDSPVYFHELFHTLGDTYRHNLFLIHHPDYAVTCTYRCLDGLSYLNEPYFIGQKKYLKNLCLRETRPFDTQHISGFNSFYRRDSDKGYSYYNQNVNAINRDLLESYKKFPSINSLLEQLKQRTKTMGLYHKHAVALFMFEIISNDRKPYSDLRRPLMDWINREQKNIEIFGRSMGLFKHLLGYGKGIRCRDYKCSSQEFRVVQFIEQLLENRGENFFGQKWFKYETLFKNIINIQINNDSLSVEIPEYYKLNQLSFRLEIVPLNWIENRLLNKSQVLTHELTKKSVIDLSHYNLDQQILKLTPVLSGSERTMEFSSLQYSF